MGRVGRLEAELGVHGRHQILREDKRAIFSAAAHAQRAVDFLHNLSSRDEAILQPAGDTAEGGP